MYRFDSSHTVSIYFTKCNPFPSGAAMSLAAREFSDSPCASAARAAMVRASRALLCAVTRLLILADMVDVHDLLGKLTTVSMTYSVLFTFCTHE